MFNRNLAYSLWNQHNINSQERVQHFPMHTIDVILVQHIIFLDTHTRRDRLQTIDGLGVLETVSVTGLSCYGYRIYFVKSVKT